MNFEFKRQLINTYLYFQQYYESLDNPIDKFAEDLCSSKGFVHLTLLEGLRNWLTLEPEADGSFSEKTLDFAGLRLAQSHNLRIVCWEKGSQHVIHAELKNGDLDPEEDDSYDYWVGRFNLYSKRRPLLESDLLNSEILIPDPVIE